MESMSDSVEAILLKNTSTWMTTQDICTLGMSYTASSQAAQPSFLNNYLSFLEPSEGPHDSCKF